jgi:hypothetical protein
MKWEYKAFPLADGLRLAVWEERLNVLGDEGWELVAITHAVQDTDTWTERVRRVAFFKRPKSN